MGGGGGGHKVHYGPCENNESGALFEGLQWLSPCLMPFLVNVFFHIRGLEISSCWSHGNLCRW